MLSREDNELLTRIGPDTPAGALFRRYWQPVAAAAELTDEKPVMKLRVLGEDLVLYKGTEGGYGLVGEQCSHRFASLSYGRVEGNCIRCPYHGWKYDTEGHCVEMPAEPNPAALADKVIHTAYPVRLQGGLLFTYMGPAPAPALPKWDVLAWEHGHRWVRKFVVLNCNWLQAMENSVDPSHLFWLHGSSAHLAKVMDHYDEQHDFINFEYGIMKRRTTAPTKPGDKPQVDQHPLLFPNVLRHVSSGRNGGGRRHNLQCRIPIDDTHTQILIVNFEPDPNVVAPTGADVPLEHFDFRDGADGFRMDQVPAQDAMAWETQGPIMDRTRERLGVADQGLVAYRRLLKQQIELVQAGGTPMGIIPADSEPPIIELDVINERIGLERPEEVRGAA